MNLSYFDFYISNGLKPIPVFKDSKRPVAKGWNLDWSEERWRPYFLTDEYNIGIVLGDIIDVEGDTPEACDLLERMIDGVKRPKFRSSKSVHNLFLNPDPNLTRVVFNDIEFRGHKHQSVAPPSLHSDGCKYSFLEGTEWPIPPMPQELLDYYHRNLKEKEFAVEEKIFSQPKIRKGCIKTICKTCNREYFIHEKRLILEVKAFRENDSLWMCHLCRKMDIRNLCRKIKKKDREILSSKNWMPQ
jgi:hypothetical protein